MLLHKVLGGAPQLHCHEFVAFSFETCDNLTDQCALNAIGLDHNVCCFLFTCNNGDRDYNGDWSKLAGGEKTVLFLKQKFVKMECFCFIPSCIVYLEYDDCNLQVRSMVIVGRVCSK